MTRSKRTRRSQSRTRESHHVDLALCVRVRGGRLSELGRSHDAVGGTADPSRIAASGKNHGETQWRAAFGPPPLFLWGFIRGPIGGERLSFCPIYRLLSFCRAIRLRIPLFDTGFHAFDRFESAATLETLRKHHVLVPADDAALCAPVLDSVFLGVQRQFPQELAGLLDSLPYRRLAG